ncbi:unnamed protein product [Eruca vesicaria subsp. sativa]|uniref:Plectin/eS10 N-terminal domain-containing protein n=1 Tax=Eruca vesicaria subsp. sativa TaxID=29727 RepID=A0ABC8KVF7_ERUVS|nr:unnamed protein product [Eruca vesicaria subsp. sativa]
MSEENSREICKYLFKVQFPIQALNTVRKSTAETIDFNLAEHHLIESVPNLQVIKLMQSFKSKEYKSAKPIGRPFGGDRPRGPRFEGGDRPRYGDRACPRGGEGEKGGAPADYQPSFQLAHVVHLPYHELVVVAGLVLAVVLELRHSCTMGSGLP